MKLNKLKKKGKIQCGCCKAYVDGRERTYVEKAYQQFTGKRGEHYIKLKSLLNYLPWACDSCVNGKEAIPARPKVQNYYGYDLPYFMYYDKERHCVQCHKDFIFSKEEQKYWYEDLKFYVHALPTRCKDCRKDRRAMIARNNRLMELNAITHKSLENLKELALLYTEIGSEQKAMEYHNRVKKLIHKKTSG